MAHPSAHLLSSPTNHLPISSQSIVVVNEEQSHQAKKFHWAFPNYDLILCASGHVDPPKSGEDPCKTHEIICDLGVSLP